jgi:hypothetical protein
VGRAIAVLCVLACLVSPALASPTDRASHAPAKKRPPVHTVRRGSSAVRTKRRRQRSYQVSRAKAVLPKPAMPLPVTGEPLLVEISHQQPQVAPALVQPVITPTPRRSWFHWRERVEPLTIPLAKQSWVMPLSNADASQLGTMIAETVHSRFPDARSFYIRPSVQDNPLTTCLKYRLTALGHRLSAVENEGIAVRYRVGRLHQGVLVTIKLPSQQIARFYQRSPSGTLVAGGPVSSLEEP